MNGAGWPGITWNWILSSTSAPGGKHWTVNLNSNHAQAGQSADLVDATQFAYSCVKP